MAGTLHPENFYKIESFKGSSRDRKLIKLGFFLKYLTRQQNIIPIGVCRKTFENMEIKLKEVNRIKENETQKEIIGERGDETVNEFSKQQNS